MIDRSQFTPIGEWEASQTQSARDPNYSPVDIYGRPVPPPAPQPAAPAPEPEPMSWMVKAGKVGEAINHGILTGATGGLYDLATHNAGEWKKAEDKNSEAHPWANAGGKVTGLVGSMLTPARYLYGVAGSTAPLRIGYGTIGGAPMAAMESGIESYRKGNDAETIRNDALRGGAYGVLGGFGGGVLGETIAPLGKKIASFFTAAPKAGGQGSNITTKWASDRIADGMEGYGATPASVMGDTAHFPGAWVADHPSMAGPLQEVRRAGGDAHAELAREATERASREQQILRLKADAQGPSPLYADKLAKEQAQAGKNVEFAVKGLPAGVDTRQLAYDLDTVVNRGVGVTPNPHVNKIADVRDNLGPHITPAQLHNEKQKLSYPLNGSNDRVLEEKARSAIDATLDGKFPIYDKANQEFRLTKLMEEAMALGAQGKRADPAAVRYLMDQAGQLGHVPDATQRIAEAMHGGMRDATYYGGGPLSRETLIEKTANSLRRGGGGGHGNEVVLAPESVAAINSHGGWADSARAYLMQKGANAIQAIMKPGEEHGKALANFLRLSGPERAQLLEQVGARSASVAERSKIMSDILKAGSRGGAMFAAEQSAGELNKAEKRAKEGKANAAQ